MKKLIVLLLFISPLFAEAQTDTLDNSIAPASSKLDISDTGIYSFVEEMPEFPGGQNAMYSFLSKNLVYPKKAIENDISGKVYVQFVVRKDGALDNIKISKGLGYGCDEEVIRVLKLMPKWKPGKSNGKPVATQFTLPVAFTLN